MEEYGIENTKEFFEGIVDVAKIYEKMGKDGKFGNWSDIQYAPLLVPVAQKMSKADESLKELGDLSDAESETLGTHSEAYILANLDVDASYRDEIMSDVFDIAKSVAKLFSTIKRLQNQ